MWRLLFGLLSILLAGAVTAKSINLQIGEAIADKFQISGLQSQLDFSGNHLTLSLQADALTLPDPIGRVAEMAFHCDELQLRSAQWYCGQGELSFQHAMLGAQTLSISEISSRETGIFSLAFSGLQWAGGHWSVTADWQQGIWQADVTAQGIDAGQLNTVLKPLVFDPLVSDIVGMIDITANVQGEQQQLSSVNGEIGIQSLALSNSEGSLATENMNALIDIKANHQVDGWQWQQHANLDTGELYVAPVYLDISAQPLTVSTSGFWQPAGNQIDVTQFRFEHHDVLQAEGEIKLLGLQLQSVNTELKSTRLQALYDIWLQPFVFDTAADDATLQGEVQTTLDWQAGAYDLSLQLAEVNISDNQQRFDITGLDGNLAWTSRERNLPVDLNWRSAHFYQIPVGDAQLRANAAKNKITLSESLSLPLLDGELQLDDFQLSYPPDGAVNWSFEGLLKPVSMPVLTDALDWPLLQGKLSGVIPAVRYQDQQVSVEGALMVKMFEGTAIIRDLELSQPFGVAPHLSANVDINQLDLQTLTTAFDFGRISGTLDGYLHDLQLSNWRPVQFDGWLATDETADTPRRISQRAVNNLSRIGGGAGGLLSRSFLRFFDDFSYKRLGLGCRLSHNICEMRGVSDAEQGYHIVEGGGLPPWINVIGYNRRVDWPVLIERLQSVSESDGPVIE